MKITSNSINFKGKIIDSHVHCGEWTNDTFGFSDIDSLFRKRINKGKDKLDKVVISNLDCIKRDSQNKPLQNEIDGNTSLLEYSKTNSGYLPLVVCQPEFGNVKNVEFLIKKYPEHIKGLKFHPACLGVSADSKSYYPYMELAQKYGLPCLFHSEIEMDSDGELLRGGVSDPKLIYELAKKFPDVPVVLGHMGLGSAKANEACVDVLIESIENQDALLYADLAWVDWDNESKEHIIEAIGRLQNTTYGDKTQRLLFGTDAPLGIFGESELFQDGAYEKNILDIKKAIRNNFEDEANKIISRIFYRNANKLFNRKIDVNI